MKITDDYLLANGWTRSESELDKQIDEELDWRTYTKTIQLTNDVFYITIRYGATNHLNTNWGVHVDNSYHETIGSVDIETFEQFNMFMDVLNINYRL